MPGVNGVLEVVNRICDVVRPVHDLRLDAPGAFWGSAAQPLKRRKVVLIHAELWIVVAARPRVLRCGVQGRAREVESGAASGLVDHLRLEPGEDSERLRVSLEAAARISHLVERLLTV